MTGKRAPTEGSDPRRTPDANHEASYLAPPADGTDREGLFAPPPADPAGMVAFAGGLNILLGVWLILAPTVLNYDNTGRGFDAYWNDRVVGATVAMLAILRVAMPNRFGSLSWLNMALGAWLIAAPFVLDYNAGVDAPTALANDIVIGVFVMLVAMASAIGGLITRHDQHRDKTAT